MTKDIKHAEMIFLTLIVLGISLMIAGINLTVPDNQKIAIGLALLVLGAVIGYFGSLHLQKLK